MEETDESSEFLTIIIGIFNKRPINEWKFVPMFYHINSCSVLGADQCILFNLSKMKLYFTIFAEYNILVNIFQWRSTSELDLSCSFLFRRH